MNLPPPFKPGPVAVCPQGQRVQWLGYKVADDLHWFGVSGVEPLCPWCWQQVSCPRQFAYEPAAHEIWTDPLASRVSRQLLQQHVPGSNGVESMCDGIMMQPRWG